MNAVHNPSIQIALMERIPCTAQQLDSRIANRISEKPQTAGSSMMKYTYSTETADYNQAIRSLEQSYEGAARIFVKSFENNVITKAQKIESFNKRTFDEI